MKKPNLNRIIADNLDKAKFQTKSNPTTPTDGWVNKYKRGGGMFPEYDSYAPPRHAMGGLLSRTVTCSNCGHSWKGVDGGEDVMTCHKCGGMIKMQNGGPGPKKPFFPVNNFTEPNYIAGQNPEGRYGYSDNTIWYDPNSEIENVNNPWWVGHEQYHHYQKLSGKDKQGQRDAELDAKVDDMIKANPELQFVPRSKLIEGSKSFPGAEVRMYEDPNTVEGGARAYEQYIENGGKSIFPKGNNNSRNNYPTESAPLRKGVEFKNGGMTQYGPGGAITDGCPPNFTKNAFGDCVNASGQTQQQAKASQQILKGVVTQTTTKPYTMTPIKMGQQNMTGNSGTTGVNRINYSSTPQGKHHEATINTMKTSPGMSYQQASDRVDMTNSSKDNTSSMRSLTANEVEKNRIAQKNKQWRKTHMNWVPGVESENEKVERWKKEDAEHDADLANTNSAILAKDNGQAYTFPTGKTKTWKEMDWREKAYITGQAQSRDLKLFPNATSNETLKTTIDEYNPFPILNRWIKGAATSPYVARETDSYIPYVGAVADPLITMAAIYAGQPELTAGEIFTKNILNWKKPFQTIGKAMVAAEEGELAGFAVNKLRKDLIKDQGKDLIKNTETNITESDKQKEQNPISSQQMTQLINTPSNQGINRAGILNPSILMSIGKGFTGMGLGVPNLIPNNKYGGSTEQTKNWTTKYK